MMRFSSADSFSGWIPVPLSDDPGQSPGRTGCSSSAHRFNLHPPLGTPAGRWETLPSLLQPRCDAAAVSRGSVVFLLGEEEARAVAWSLKS